MLIPICLLVNLLYLYLFPEHFGLTAQSLNIPPKYLTCYLLPLRRVECNTLYDCLVQSRRFFSPEDIDTHQSNKIKPSARLLSPMTKQLILLPLSCRNYQGTQENSCCTWSTLLLFFCSWQLTARSSWTSSISCPHVCEVYSWTHLSVSPSHYRLKTR